MTTVAHREALTMQPSDMQVPPPADWQAIERPGAVQQAPAVFRRHCPLILSI